MDDEQWKLLANKAWEVTDVKTHKTEDAKTDKN